MFLSSFILSVHLFPPQRVHQRLKLFICGNLHRCPYFSLDTPNFSSYPLFHFSLSHDTTAAPPDASPDESALALPLLPAMTVFYPSLMSRNPAHKPEKAVFLIVLSMVDIENLLISHTLLENMNSLSWVYINCGLIVHCSPT